MQGGLSLPVSCSSFGSFHAKTFERPIDFQDNHILAQNLYCNYYYPKPKYLIIGYFDRKS